MFALREKRYKSRPQSRDIEGFEYRNADFDVSSPVPQSLVSTIHSDDFSFSPWQDDAGPSRKRPLPSMSTSFMISPLRRAMKMSGILETPPSPTDVPCSFNPRPYSVLDFTRQEVHPVIDSPKQSGLTQLLSSPAAPITNPFSHLRPQSKSRSAGKEPQRRITITVYFPHASTPSGDALVLDLPEEARVEELVGLALWTYWEKGWLPQLSVNHTEDREACKLIASSWHVYPVNDGFIDYENGAHDPSDKVRLLNGVVEFALLKTNKAVKQDDDRRTQQRHRKHYSFPSNKMNLLLHARKKSYGSRHISTKSVIVRKGSDELELVMPTSTGVDDIVSEVCRSLNLSRPQDYVLKAKDVTGTLRVVPPSHRLSRFPDSMEFTLARCEDSSKSRPSRQSLPNSYVYVHL
ncbi:hypothetical protein PM082_017899 [Marasmius tenuissimus]|nr:hypothetical protein PM082_017899 [Marasmius tenuissimus]